MVRYTTRKKQIFADRTATFFITLVGIGVIFAVAGMMVFLIETVVPLGKSERLETPIASKTLNKSFALARDNSIPLRLELASLDSKKNPSNCAVDFFIETETPRLLARFYIVSPGAIQDTYELSVHNPGLNELKCIGLSNSEILILPPKHAGKGQFAARLTMEFSREFLSEEAFSLLPPDAVTHLNANKFYVTRDDIIYAKTSPTAPLAQIKPALLPLDTFVFMGPTDFFNPPLANEREFHFQNSDNGTGLFVVQDTLGRFKNAFIFGKGTDPLSSVKETAKIPIIPIPMRQSTEAEVVGIHLVGEEELWYFLRDGKIIRSGLPKLNQPPPVLANLQIEGIQHFLNASKMVGGSALFFDSGDGNCGVIDAGRIARIHPIASSTSSQEAALWRSPCAKSLWSKLVASPSKRFVLRLFEEGAESFETTTGRRPFHYTLQQLTDLSGNQIFLDHFQPEHLRLSFSRNGENIIVVVEENIFSFPLFAPHLEASIRAFFKQVHYEGYENESFSWQSTSGSDDFQAKYSLVPLIWGTVKATLYALIFAIPLGILASIYSSEILDRQTRNIIKPSIEMMASLPSVVLGFIAAILIAPWVENHVVSVLFTGLAMPFVLYLSGNLLSALSAKQISARGLYASRRLLVWLMLGVVLSLTLLIWVGKFLERSAFGGDIKNYLAGGPGTEGVLWGILFLPAILILLWSFPVKKGIRIYRTGAFLLGPALSFAAGTVISRLGGSHYNLFGIYSQRNTLVIAIAMGFAIIPIIFSLAEDALTAVPASLRAASLACGASVWQTTARVVLPTAASGLFSAVMVGLGRGIGETMIAVMATGNSAVMNFSPFDGLRTLAANIAVELPEAPHGSTHYRILFLSGLILFGFTFILNSLAEMLRSRYRERNKAL